jgi:hypothetical protein
VQNRTGAPARTGAPDFARRSKDRRLHLNAHLKMRATYARRAEARRYVPHSMSSRKVPKSASA